ncbi:MAG: FtsH protease activity modulator HflK [Eubacteriales bacterium]|nr:FtsH protease activity modulator HflK [Clostridiales bacterium]MDY5835971.1 FtsH protease activity modulator HflK [Eubacteriales bacterium]
MFKKKTHKPFTLKGRNIVLVLILALAVYLVSTGIYTVRESEQAVIQTFGKYTATTGPGLHVKLPWPIQEVTILQVQRTQKMELGYYQDDTGTYHSEEDDSLMITGDMNVVNIDFFMEWKISDPLKYLYASEEPEAILRNLLMASVRSVVGTKSIDDALTSGKYEIQNEVQDMMVEKLMENDIGVQVLDVKVNDSEPPTEEVAKAFRDVETAKQEMEMAINRAAEYRNRRLPEAKSQADRLVKDAEAYKASRVAEAEGLRDRYLAIYNEYKNFPEISRNRMYLEVLERTLPGIKVIVDESGEVSKYLPLQAGETLDNVVADQEAQQETSKGGK